MMTITKITNIDNKKHIALLDTSSISFMQGLHEKGITSEEILKDYDLILIPKWVLTEIKDAEGRVGYLEQLIYNYPSVAYFRFILRLGTREIYHGRRFE